ncbi:unnamed protein product [Chrysoparadoxa australica]
MRGRAKGNATWWALGAFACALSLSVACDVDDSAQVAPCQNGCECQGYFTKTIQGHSAPLPYCKQDNTGPGQHGGYFCEDAPPQCPADTVPCGYTSSQPLEPGLRPYYKAADECCPTATHVCQDYTARSGVTGSLAMGNCVLKDQNRRCPGEGPNDNLGPSAHAAGSQIFEAEDYCNYRHANANGPLSMFGGEGFIGYFNEDASNQYSYYRGPGAASYPAGTDLYAVYNIGAGEKETEDAAGSLALYLVQGLDCTAPEFGRVGFSDTHTPSLFTTVPFTSAPFQFTEAVQDDVFTVCVEGGSWATIDSFEITESPPAFDCTNDYGCQHGCRCRSYNTGQKYCDEGDAPNYAGGLACELPPVTCANDKVLCGRSYTTQAFGPPLLSPADSCCEPTFHTCELFSSMNVVWSQCLLTDQSIERRCVAPYADEISPVVEFAAGQAIQAEDYCDFGGTGTYQFPPIESLPEAGDAEWIGFLAEGHAFSYYLGPSQDKFPVNTPMKAVYHIASGSAARAETGDLDVHLTRGLECPGEELGRIQLVDSQSATLYAFNAVESEEFSLPDSGGDHLTLCVNADSHWSNIDYFYLDWGYEAKPADPSINNPAATPAPTPRRADPGVGIVTSPSAPQPTSLTMETSLTGERKSTFTVQEQDAFMQAVSSLAMDKPARINSITDARPGPASRRLQQSGPAVVVNYTVDDLEGNDADQVKASLSDSASLLDAYNSELGKAGVTERPVTDLSTAEAAEPIEEEIPAVGPEGIGSGPDLVKGKKGSDFRMLLAIIGGVVGIIALLIAGAFLLQKKQSLRGLRSPGGSKPVKKWRVCSVSRAKNGDEQPQVQPKYHRPEEEAALWARSREQAWSRPETGRPSPRSAPMNRGLDDLYN